MMRLSLLVTAAILLAGCGEKPQTLGGGRQDGPAYKGTGTSFAADGWKQGDKTSWEQHLKVRTQAGQNDYTKAN